MYKTYKKDEKVPPKESWSSYQDDDLDSDNDLENDGENDFDNNDEDDDQQDNGKGGKSKKKYSVISQAVREKFINRVLSKEVTIKEAAKEFGLKFSTSKAILQTYKKEGRIGKKKNRERKTKVVNAVFIANISALNPFVSSLPLGPLNEIKNMNLSASTDASSSQQFENGFNKYSDAKGVKNAIGGGLNTKVTQNIIKEFGNDFLRDFIEKNFGQGRLNSIGGISFDRAMSNSNELNNLQNTANLSSSINLPNVSNQRTVINFGTSNTNKTNQPLFNALSGLSTNSLLPQKISSINSDTQQTFNFGQNKAFSQFRQNSTDEQNKNNLKRSFQSYEKDGVPELLPRNDSINDISVKRFKSGEDSLWDFDMDKSKKDLEDFIYKTHNAMKNASTNENKTISNYSDYS